MSASSEGLLAAPPSFFVMVLPQPVPGRLTGPQPILSRPLQRRYRSARDPSPNRRWLERRPKVAPLFSDTLVNSRLLANCHCQTKDAPTRAYLPATQDGGCCSHPIPPSICPATRDSEGPDQIRSLNIEAACLQTMAPDEGQVSPCLTISPTLARRAAMLDTAAT